MKIWIWYGVGAFLTLVWKLALYLYRGRKADRQYGAMLGEWFFEASKENATSWITTLAVVWAFGFLYIGNHVIQGAEFIDKIPDAPPFAFLLGSLMELAAPAAAKWVLGKLPGGGS